jgi:hypothetical protein
MKPDHIRDMDCLNGALLIFPNIYRFVPSGFKSWDDPCVSRVCLQSRGRGPLLDEAFTSRPPAERGQPKRFSQD